MSDNFIPFNQSTPVQNIYKSRKQHSAKWRGGHKHSQMTPYNSRNRSNGSNSSDNRFSHERHNIDNIDNSSNIEMSDHVISFNRSTPMQNRSQQAKGNQQRYDNRQQHGGYNHSQFTPCNWNNSSNRSYGSNSSDNRFSHERHNIDNIDNSSNIEMSDHVISFNRSTPMQNRSQQAKGNQQRYDNRQQHGGYNHSQFTPCNWNNSRNRSYGNNLSSHESHDIDAYLHPSMLQDPWASLRQNNASEQNSSSI